METLTQVCATKVGPPKKSLLVRREMLIGAGSRDYTFSLPKILAALVEQAWGRYGATVPYPEWMKNNVEEAKERRPVGRPREHPKVLIEGKVGRRTPTDQGKRQPMAAYRFGGLENTLLQPGESGLMSMIG